jgi:hypothetical protein
VNNHFAYEIMALGPVLLTAQLARGRLGLGLTVAKRRHVVLEDAWALPWRCQTHPAPQCVNVVS